MKKIKLKNVIFVNEFVPALRELIKRELPVTIAYKLMKFVKQIETKAVVFNEARVKMLETYGEKGEDNKYVIPKEKTVEANQEWQKILNIEEEYEVEKVKLPEDVKIKTSELIILEKILKVA